MSSLTNDLNVYYYSTVEFVETPLSYIKGSIPLRREVALQRNHYRFSYDAQNRLISVGFFNGSTPRHPNHTANLFTLSHRMEFTYEDRIQRIDFFDENGQKITVLGDCSQFVFTLDEFGYRKSLYFLDGQGNRIQNSWNIYEYRWQHQNDGTVIENRFDKEGNEVSIRPGFEFYRLKLSFNHLGHIALMQNIDSNGNLVTNASGASQDRITTNAMGNFLCWEVLDNNHQLERGNGPNVATGIQTFDKYGNEITIEHRDENNQPIHSAYGIFRSQTRYDSFGNLSERRFFDEDGNPSNHQMAGYHRLYIEWEDSGNNRKRLSYYDLNNSSTSHRTRGYHAAEYEYNQNGDLSRVSFLDENGSLINRKDNGIAYILYQYNRDGIQKLVTEFDKNGMPIKTN